MITGTEATDSLPFTPEDDSLRKQTHTHPFSLHGCWMPMLPEQNRLFCNFEGDLLVIGKGRELNYTLNQEINVNWIVGAFFSMAACANFVYLAWDISIFFFFFFLYVCLKTEVHYEAGYKFYLSDSLKWSWRNGSHSLVRCGECFIVLNTAVNANDSKAVKKALNEFQHFNVLQVPNCTNLRSLAIQYLLNNSIYFILWIHLGKPQ